HRAFQRHLVAQNRVEHVLRQWVAVAREGLRADEVFLPLDVDAGALDDRHHRRGDLRPDAVTGKQRDFVLRHRATFWRAPAPHRPKTTAEMRATAPRIPAARAGNARRSPASAE